MSGMASAGREAIAALADELAAARRIALFTGAGISTESGIPDFRSPGGMWSRLKPIDFADFVASEEMRREAWRRKFASDPVMRAARPNRGHLACAALVARGTAKAIITQNIDGLHQMAGVPDGQVIEVHGNATYAHCLDCGTRYELDTIRAAFEREEVAPRCRWCDGLVKTATISFGQKMPVEAMRRAEAETLAADCFVVLGSSLVVYPAAGLPLLAQRNGARLIIVNREPTDMDAAADLVINDSIGDTFGAAVELL
jgi:NAD-dependent deacetylase